MSVHIEAKVGEIAETVLLPGGSIKSEIHSRNILGKSSLLQQCAWNVRIYREHIKEKKYLFKELEWEFHR